MVKMLCAILLLLCTSSVYLTDSTLTQEPQLPAYFTTEITKPLLPAQSFNGKGVLAISINDSLIMLEQASARPITRDGKPLLYISGRDSLQGDSIGLMLGDLLVRLYNIVPQSISLNINYRGLKLNSADEAVTMRSNGIVHIFDTMRHTTAGSFSGMLADQSTDSLYYCYGWYDVPVKDK